VGEEVGDRDLGPVALGELGQVSHGRIGELQRARVWAEAVAAAVPRRQASDSRRCMVGADQVARQENITPA